jgi:hypothetical protein
VPNSGSVKIQESLKMPSGFSLGIGPFSLPTKLEIPYLKELKQIKLLKTSYNSLKSKIKNLCEAYLIDSNLIYVVSKYYSRNNRLEDELAIANQS